MKRYYFVLVVLGFVLTFVACGPSNTVTEDDATAGAPRENETTLEELPTTLEEVPADGYPEAEQPVATAVPEEYPIATVPPPAAAYPDASDAYPAAEGQVWVIRPVGVQCEDPEYTDIQDAITDLTAIGVEVLDSETFELATASVCGGPTSAHFRVLITAEDVNAAGALDWIPFDG